VLYRKATRLERFFNRVKDFRGIASRCGKRLADFPLRQGSPLAL
jgi:transposase